MLVLRVTLKRGEVVPTRTVVTRLPTIAVSSEWCHDLESVHHYLLTHPLI